MIKTLIVLNPLHLLQFYFLPQSVVTSSLPLFPNGIIKIKQIDDPDESQARKHN